MKNKIFTISFLSLLIISQFSFINSKNDSLFTKVVDNPFVPYSSDPLYATHSKKSIDLVEENSIHSKTNLAGIGTAYVQVIDNANSDFFKNTTEFGTTEGMMNMWIYGSSGGYLTERGYFYPSLSNIKNNDTYYMSYNASVDSNLLEKYWDVDFALGSSENEIGNTTDVDAAHWYTMNDDCTIEDITTIEHYQPIDNTYPYISPYTIENDDVFQINTLSPNGDLTFTIKVDNWTESTDIDYLTEEQNIGVTLVNEDEPDEYLKYEQYEANLTNHSGNYYTYKISGINPDVNYNFYSINFTGLTIGDIEYYPDFDIRLNEELGVPTSYTIINNDPYIDSSLLDVFTIDNVEAKSIEFSLKIIDTADHKYLSYLNDVDNTIDVSLMKEGTSNQIETEATFESSDDNIFKFKIIGLDSKTNYEFISINNTDLIVDGEVDNEILISEDLGIADSVFTTGSNFIFYLIISIAILLVLLGIIILIIFTVTKNKKDRKFSRAVSSMD